MHLIVWSFWKNEPNQYCYTSCPRNQDTWKANFKGNQIRYKSLILGIHYVSYVKNTKTSGLKVLQFISYPVAPIYRTDSQRSCNPILYLAYRELGSGIPDTPHTLSQSFRLSPGMLGFKETSLGGPLCARCFLPTQGFGGCLERGYCVGIQARSKHKSASLRRRPIIFSVWVAVLIHCSV